MSLRVTGRPITLGPPPVIEGVPSLEFKKQKNNWWCWAACVEMVLKHHEVSNDEQCQIGQKGLTKIGVTAVCCNAQNDFNNNDACERTLHKPEITRLWEEEYPEIPVQSFSGMPVDRAQLTNWLRERLNEGKLVEIGYDRGEKEHVVILYGWSKKPTDNKISFHIHDPECAPNTIIEASEIDDNDYGIWVATWLIPKPV